MRTMGTIEQLATLVAKGGKFNEIVASFKAVMPDGRLGFDPNKLPSPLKENLVKRVLPNLTPSQQRAFLSLRGIHGVSVAESTTATNEVASQQTNQQTNGAIAMTATAAPAISSDATAQLAGALQAILGGFDANKVRETVQSEVKAATDNIRSEFEAAQRQAKDAAREASEVRVAVNTAKQEVNDILSTIREDAEALVKDALSKALPTRLEVVTPKGEVKDVGVQHERFPKLLKLMATGVNVWMPGPAGSGKSTGVHKAAEAMGLNFYHQGKVINDFQLLGYKDAHGNYHPTEFRKAFEFGGVFLADESDSWTAEASLVLNMAIENGAMAFPDKTVPRHEDFRMVAAANTFGNGATAEYVGRNKLDGAFLDRFAVYEWGYDEKFETMLSGNAAWANRVQAWRKRANAKGLKVIISPRASIVGAKLLAAGFDEAEVIDMVVKKGMSKEQWLAIN